MSIQIPLKDFDKLDSQIDKLEAALEPFLANMDEMSRQLPLLDRAKLYSNMNYAIGTLLFSTEKLNSPDALQHPVYTTELKRVQQYFKKIEAAENPPKRTATVDTEAATRMIRAGVSDDAALKNKLAEQIAKEKAKAFLQNLGKRPADGEASSSQGETKKPTKKQKLANRKKAAKEKAKGDADA